ncbi:stage III sporulation protein AA [Desulfothermobacter acidiphilus]|uniref:stage III sporulation protein AA n=1 Tax=Desulfothermobacter acidiphilus TaxID=1938353 RepID=UPI003F8B595A
MNQTARKYILSYLPDALGQLLDAFSPWSELEEVRLRARQPLALRLTRGEFFLSPDGKLSLDPAEGYIVQPEDLVWVLNAVTGSSLYAFEEEVRQGYLTLPGGHRLGLTGQPLQEGGRIKTFSYVGSLNLRLARELKGVSEPFFPYLLHGSPPSATHILILSPPRGGKTTFLRDLVRLLSLGVPALGFRGITVGLVDERGEVAACRQGVPQLDVGPRTDVLTNCTKVEGIRLLLRAFAPEVIAMDELGREEEVRAVEDALNAGVRVVATAHASSLEELERRPFFRWLFRCGVVQRFVLLSHRGMRREVVVLDGEGRVIR